MMMRTRGTRARPRAGPAAAAPATRRGRETENAGRVPRRDVPGPAPEAARDPPGEGDAAIMRSLFGGGGTIRGGGVIRGAMNHDAIVNASGGRDHLVGGSAAAEADRVARRAHAAVTQSGRARLASNVAVPTWTGRSGAGRAARAQASNSAVGRFGRRGGAAAASGAPGGVVGVAGASRHGGGSQTLLQRIRSRDAAAAAGGSDVELSGAAAEVSAEALLRDVVAFLRARPSRARALRAGRGRVQDRVGPTQHALFRRLLKVAATLEKNPPNAAGAGGGAAWVLKDEFR